MKCDDFGGFEAICREFHTVAILLQHATDKLAYADGIVDDDNDTLVLNAVDGFGGNGAARYRFGTRSEHASGAGARLQCAAFVRLRGHHAVQIDQKNQTAVGSDGRPREYLFPPPVL